MTSDEFRLSNGLNFVVRTSHFGLPPAGFVNGLPRVVIDLKKPGVSARAALERLNASRMGHHALPPEAITAAVDELTRDRLAIIPLL